MHENLGMFLDGLGDQVRDESIHLAFLAFVGGVGIVASILGWLLRRDIKRSDEDQKALATAIVGLEKKVDANKDRTGYEISDTRLAVERLFAKLGYDQPKYPSR